MDFFASQERAEKQTRLMLVLFLLAVVCIVLAINIVGGLIYLFANFSHADSVAQGLSTVPHKAYWITTAVVLGVIAYGSINRMSSLAGGGAAVAEMLGARRVEPNGSDLAERRLTNVVEEMAIAAGIPMPMVYVMDDQRGINAFAAGYSSSAAVITVTKGALDRLNRDELQGVVAHEFSHILNGDMRLNIRLMGVIAGIVTIGAIGSFLMRMGGYGDDGGTRRRGDIRLFALGLTLWLIGSIGVFFGTLIKAAVSRQREFLADASAVQFTRNPEGIGGALYRIGQHGSNVVQRYAEELSHMYFSAGMDSFFATHPPIKERVDRILGPGAAYTLKRRIAETAVEEAATSESPLVDALQSPLSATINADGTVEFDNSVSAFGGPTTSDRSGLNAVQTTPAAMMASVGQLSAVHVEYARQFIESLPTEVRRALNTAAGARAALFALVLGEGEIRKSQLALVGQRENAMMAAAVEQQADLLKPLGIRARMPVFDLAMRSLRNLQAAERDATIALLEQLINADGKVTLGEFVLLALCRSHLKPSGGPGTIKYRTVQGAARHVTTILSLLLRAGQSTVDNYAQVVATLGLNATDTVPVIGISFRAVEAALGELKQLAPQGKASFIKACLEIVIADGQITITEGELMRAICSTLDVPLPPLIEEQAVA